MIGDNGYDLLLFASDRPGNGYGEHSYLKRCRHHAVEGAVLMGVDPDDPEVRRLAALGPALRRRRRPSASARRPSYVVSDNESGSAARGAPPVRARPPPHRDGRRRREHPAPAPTGCAATAARCASSGCPYRDEYVVFGDFYLESGRRLAGRLLDLPERPTAIVAASDMMALGALRAASDRGLRLPEDLSVVGFDDMQLAAHVHPPLTTLRQDKLGLGAEAGRALLARIDGSEDEPLTITLPVDLVERASTAPPG